MLMGQNPQPDLEIESWQQVYAMGKMMILK